MNSEIVVVDNNSSNKSGKQLENQYKETPRIHFLFVEENIGFSRGNNIGYCYAKNILGADVIVVMNNDVLITQSDFENRVIEIFECNDHIAIVGPKIINRSGTNQNPFRIRPISTRSLLKILVFNCVYCIVLVLHAPYGIIHKYAHRFGIITTENCENAMNNIVLHGSCILFYKEYINKVDFAFPPVTYFYGEEDILYDFATRNNFEICYNPLISVSHMEKVSTNGLTDSNRNKEMIITERKIHGTISRIRFRLNKRWFVFK